MSYANPNVLPSGTSFTQFQAGGASGHLERLIAANSAAELNPTTAATLLAAGGGTVGGLLAQGVYYVNFTETNGYGETTVSAESGSVTIAAQAAPTGAATVVVSGTGGTLAAGVYRAKFTYVDSNLNASSAFGETTAGTEFSFTQTAGAQPVITVNDGGLPSWASGRNLYLTLPGGATNTEVLAFTGITAATYTLTTAPPPSTTAPPAANTTTTNIPKITAFPPSTGQLREKHLPQPGRRRIRQRSPIRPRGDGINVHVQLGPSGLELCRRPANGKHHRLLGG